MTIKITTVTGMEFEMTGATSVIIDGQIIYFAGGQSFPAEIVQEV